MTHIRTPSPQWIHNILKELKRQKEAVYDLLPSLRALELGLEYKQDYTEYFKTIWRYAKIEFLLALVVLLIMFLKTGGSLIFSKGATTAKIVVLISGLVFLPIAASGVAPFLCAIEFAGGYLITYSARTSYLWNLIEKILKRQPQYVIRAFAAAMFAMLLAYLAYGVDAIANTLDGNTSSPLDIDTVRRIQSLNTLAPVLYPIGPIIQLTILFLIPLMGALPHLITRATEKRFGTIAAIAASIAISLVLWLILPPAASVGLFLAASAAVILGALGAYSVGLPLIILAIVVTSAVSPLLALSRGADPAVVLPAILLSILTAHVSLRILKSKRARGLIINAAKSANRQISYIAGNMLTYAVIFPILMAIVPPLTIKTKALLAYMLSSIQGRGSAR